MKLALKTETKTLVEFDLVQAFLAGKSAATLRAYDKDLKDFQAFLGAATVREAANILITSAPGAANGLVLAYRVDLQKRELSSATINRRLAALRSLVKMARVLGMVTWSIEISSLEAAPIRDTKGPGRVGFEKLMEELEARNDEKSIRDRAALWLLYGLALRRGEVVALDMEDVNLEDGLLQVKGKGRSYKEALTLPAKVKAALASWIEARGTEQGALFTNYDRRGGRGRLTGAGLYKIVQGIGLDAGITVRPHGLRHAAITRALDLTNGDVRSVQRFSRHRNIQTVVLYDDSRRDMGGVVARLVAGE